MRYLIAALLDRLSSGEPLPPEAIRAQIAMNDLEARMIETRARHAFTGEPGSIITFTTSVRCAYCGTWADNKPGRCDSCGAPRLCYSSAP